MVVESMMGVHFTRAMRRLRNTAPCPARLLPDVHARCRLATLTSRTCCLPSLHRAAMARVLVVEDERDLQSILAFNLQQAGHDVLLSGSGSLGIELARQHRPDLILLDLMLPDLPG